MKDAKDPTKPTPLRVYGRSHYACGRCKVSKIKCSGEKPCSNCKNVGKGDQCQYLSRDRKILIMESDLNKLQDRVKELEHELENNKGQAKADSMRLNQSVNVNLSVNVGGILVLPGLPSSLPGSLPSSLPSSVPSIPPSIPSHLHLQNLIPFGIPRLQNFQAVQERLDLGNKEFLYNHSGLENFLISDNAMESIKWKILAISSGALPSKEVGLSLIQAVYENYATEFYLIDFKSFSNEIDLIYLLYESIKMNDYKRIEDLNKRIKRCSLCYFFILLAYGEQISNISSNEEIPGIQFYLMASELFNLTHEFISYEFIQSAILLALFSANLNRYNTVYNYFGVAIRSAISQGYHRQRLCDETDKEQLIHREKTKRLWWTIFITDATWTAKMNMPAQIDYTETDVDLPSENLIDLNDSFDVNFLELNVHLAKYISKSVLKIFGANKRTISINYINTEQFNQRNLIKNILSSFNELIKNFETQFLFQYKNCNIIEMSGRKLMNLFLRFNLLIGIITKPLILLIFKKDDGNIYEHPIEIEEAINKSISSAISNINILIKLYELGRIFMIGFYDSQYLFTSILTIIMTSITDTKCLNIVDRGVALLKLMADKGNINAQNCIKKLIEVNGYLAKTPEISYQINFNLDITKLINSKSFNYEDHYYNPYEHCPFSTFTEFKMFKDNLHRKLNYDEKEMDVDLSYKPQELPPNQVNQNQENQNQYYQDIDEVSVRNLVDQFTNNRVYNLSGTSQNTLFSMMNNLQNGDDYKNFPV